AGRAAARRADVDRPAPAAGGPAGRRQCGRVDRPALAPGRRAAGAGPGHRALGHGRAGGLPRHLAHAGLLAGRPTPARPPEPGHALPRRRLLLDLPVAPAAAVRAAVPADGPGLALATEVRRGLRRDPRGLPAELPAP